MKVLKNADLSGKQIFGKKTAKPDGRNSDFTTLWILWNGFCCQKPIDDSFRKCFQPCPLTGTDFWEKTWTSQEPDDASQPSLLRSPAHDQLQQASLGVDLPTFFGIFFSVEIPMASKMAFPQPGCLSCGLRSFLAGRFNPADFHRRRWWDGVVWTFTIPMENDTAHLVFDLPKFKVLGIKRSSLKLKLLLILLIGKKRSAGSRSMTFEN